MKMIRYTVYFEPLKEGGYGVVVPSLPGVITYGKTLREARKMAKEAIECHLEGLLKDGQPLPEGEEPSEEPIREKVSVLLKSA